jgi:LmbE family N-acetylglucosaminyl deacetylase
VTDDRDVTPESAWRQWLGSPELRPFPEEDHGHAVVVAAHPDDETLGASGLIQRLHERGTTVGLVVATDGEGAFPRLSPEDKAELGRTRRRELRESLRAQGLGEVDVHRLGLPDSGLTDHAAELAERLTPLLADADVCLVPWPDDPHPDHHTAGEVALRVAPVTAHRWSYPIWMWHWLRPDDPRIPRSRGFVHRLTDERRRRKAAGVSAFESQLKPGPDGSEAILASTMVEHFERGVEVVFRQPPERSAPLARFADLYGDGADPWGVTTSCYERRKRAIALASLPRERYGLAVEPACGVGALTAELAARCDRVIAFDPVPAAVRAARRSLSTLSTVEISQGVLPADLPTEPTDLVVFSEILYYLGDADLAATVDGAVAALRPGGHLLAVHWLPWAAEAPRDGMAAHRFLLARSGLAPAVEHVDQEFVLHVLIRR